MLSKPLLLSDLRKEAGPIGAIPRCLDITNRSNRYNRNKSFLIDKVLFCKYLCNQAEMAQAVAVSGTVLAG